MSDLSPLSSAKRKSNFGAVKSAFDPERTLGVIMSRSTAALNALNVKGRSS